MTYADELELRLRLGISPNEWEVFKRKLQSMSYKEIAAELCVSEKTVMNHQTHYRVKLGIQGYEAEAKYVLIHEPPRSPLRLFVRERQPA